MKKMLRILAVLSLLSLFTYGCSGSYHGDTSHNQIDSEQTQNNVV